MMIDGRDINEDLEEQVPPEEEEELAEDPKLSKRKAKKILEKYADLEKDLDAALLTATSWKNKYYEAYADLDNTRKVLDKDRIEMIKYRSMGFIEKLLPALDNFEMAFKTISDDPVIKNYQTGFQMILRQLLQALTDEGLKVIEPNVGDQFDHQTMSALATCLGSEDDKVSSVYLKGYLLHDRLVRPAVVVVTKKGEAAPSPSAEDSASNQ